MIKLFFDIETIPSAEEHKNIHVEIIQKKVGSKKTADEIYTETSFEGTFGRICCIGIIKEGDSGIIKKEVLSGDEKEILKEFWKTAVDVDRFVGHNVWAVGLLEIVVPSELLFRPMKVFCIPLLLGEEECDQML